MTVSLIISTYNNPEYLYLTLKSVMNQRRLPDEILIADDGSGEATRTLVEEMAAPAADVVVPQAEVPAAETEATPAN